MSRYLVIGGVAGGAAFAAKMRRLDENAEIIIFEKGSYVSYANCGLPYYIGNVITDRDSLLLHTPESLKNIFNIDVLVNTEVMSINRNKKTVTAKNLIDGKVVDYEYDKLMLSPGAYAIRPGFLKDDITGVFTLKDIPDTFSLEEYIKKNKPKKAAVIGGGFIGLETAENLAHLGLDVSVIEGSEQVMQPFDMDMAGLLHDYLVEKGINLKLCSMFEGIEQDGSSLLVKLPEEELKVDLVVLSIGVRPETALAKEAGLSIGETGGILVDDFMRTSDQDIYAAGDAVEVKNKITGSKMMLPLAGNAGKQARTAAYHILGDKRPFEGVIGTSVVKIFDLTAASTGANEKQLKNTNIDYETVRTTANSHAGYYPGAKKMHIKLVFEKNTGKILGGQIIGEKGVDKRIDVLATAIYKNLTVKDLGKLELAYAPPYSTTRDALDYAGDSAMKKM